MARKTVIKKNTETVEETDGLKKVSLFDILSEIEGAQRPWNELDEYFQKAYSQFMINRFISDKPFYAPLVALISQYKISDEMHYTYLTSFIGKQKHYFSYKSYKNTKEVDELAIYAIEHEFKLGRRDAQYYYDNLKDEEIANCKKKWKDHYDIYGKK